MSVAPMSINTSPYMQRPNTPTTPITRTPLLANAAVVAPTLNQWLSGLEKVMARGGSPAALDYLSAGKSAGPLRAALATPTGRAAVAAVMLGASVGWAAGSEAGKNVKFKATVGALQLIAADNSLSAAEKTSLAIKTLRNAVTDSPARTPAKDPYADRSWEKRTPLPDRIKVAEQRYEKTLQLLKLNPGDTDLQANAKGQKAAVDSLKQQLKDAQKANSIPATNANPTPAQQQKTAPPGYLSPATIPSGTEKKVDSGATAQKTNQPRVNSSATAEKSSFNAELKNSLAAADGQNRQRVGDLVARSSPSELKGYIGMIDKTLKTNGFGNIYKNDDRAPTAVKKNRDFNQYNTELGLLLGRDLKAIRSGLQKYLSQAPQSKPSTNNQATQTVGTEPGFDVPWGKETTSNPSAASQTDKTDKTGKTVTADDIAMVGALRTEVKAQIGKLNASPASAERTVKLDRLQKFATSLEAVSANGPLEIGGRISAGLQFLKSTLRNAFNNPPPPGGPGGPTPNWNAYAVLVVGLVAITSGVYRNDVTGKIEDVLRGGPDIKFNEYNLIGKMNTLGQKLTDPGEAAKARQEIVDHYAKQIDVKLKAAAGKGDENTGRLKEAFVVGDFLGGIRSAFNPNASDANYTPIAANINTLGNMRWLNDNRAGQIATNGLALMNRDLATFNSAVSETWQAKLSTVKNIATTAPGDELKEAYAKAGITPEQFTTVSKSTNSNDIRNMGSKFQVAINSLSSRQTSLNKEITALEKSQRSETKAVETVSALEKLFNVLTAKNPSAVDKNITNQTQEASKQSERISTAFLSLIQAKRSESASLTGTIATLQANYTSLKTAGENLKIAQTSQVVAQKKDQLVLPITNKLQALSVDVAKVTAERTSLGNDLSAKQAQLNELSRSTKAYEDNQIAAEKPKTVKLLKSQELVMSRRPEMENGRLVLNSEDVKELVAVLKNVETLRKNGAISVNEATSVRSQVEIYVNPNTGARRPLTAYPYVSMNSATKIAGALTPDQYGAAVKQRDQLVKAVSTQEAQARALSTQINSLQIEIYKARKELNDATKKVGETYPLNKSTGD